MLIFGHPYIKSESFYHIESVEAILHTPSNSTIYIIFNEKNLDLIDYARKNSIKFCLQVASLKELIFAYNLQASYIITSQENIIEAQKCAETYLFDTKIITLIKDDSEIETMARRSIDGVIYSNAIIKITS
jgi:hypothetical protein